MDALPRRIDASSPVPLFRQIADGLRYRIASGALAPGVRLPPLREAARAWGVNLHTVRRAYLELQGARLIEVRRPAGAFVAPGAPDRTRDEHARFVEEVVAEGRRRLGLDRRGVAALFATPDGTSPPARVRVAECSRRLAAVLARQISEALAVAAEPVLLSELTGKEPGPVVATWFHYSEVQAKLAAGAGVVHFVAIEPRLRRPGAIIRRARRYGGRVTLVEPDGTVAPWVAADVARLLNDGSVRIDIQSHSSPSVLLRRRHGVLVCSPSSWERLSAQERKDPDAFPLEYEINAAELARLGALLGRPVSAPPPGPAGASRGASSRRTSAQPRARFHAASAPP